MAYLPRVVDRQLDRLLAGLPAVAIEGPKAVGKTVTARRRVVATIALDDDAERVFLRDDPQRLDRLGKPESEGLNALLRELRRREIPLYLARVPLGYGYHPGTGKLTHDAEAVHRGNMEDWRPPEFIIIPRENEQDDLLADRLTLGRAGQGQPED